MVIYSKSYSQILKPNSSHAESSYLLFFKDLQQKYSSGETTYFLKGNWLTNRVKLWKCMNVKTTHDLFIFF
jgi:hypothetical protein